MHKLIFKFSDFIETESFFSSLPNTREKARIATAEWNALYVKSSLLFGAYPMTFQASSEWKHHAEKWWILRLFQDQMPSRGNPINRLLADPAPAMRAREINVNWRLMNLKKRNKIENNLGDGKKAQAQHSTSLSK